ncbi:2252_t:CDS:2, partial [Cetraspora pellucida]
SWDEVDSLTIANCWMKTGILPSVSSIDVDIAQDMHLELIEHEESEICELMVDLSNSAILQEIEAYKDVNNTHIPTEEALNNVQIIETVLVKQLENEQGDPDDSDEEPPKISASEELDELKNFILFAEKQMCDDFFLNNNDLKVFLQILTINEMKGCRVYETKFSNDDDGIPDNDYFFGDNDFPNDDHFSGDNDFLDDDYFSNDNYFSDYEGFSDNYYSSPNDIITN